MKLSIILVSFVSLSFSFASTYAQETKLSIYISNGNLKEIFKNIESQSEFSFMYDNTMINVEKKVSIQAKDQTIKEVLDQVLDKKEVQYQIIDRHIVVLPAREKQQERAITGQVTDENQSGLPGVNVIVKGTAQGTVTDVQGNYKLEVSDENTILVFSSVGYTTEEIIVGSRTVIDMALIPDITSLDEIVVIGYGAVRRRDLTAAVSGVKSDELMKRTSPNLDDALVGQMSGIRLQQATGVPGAKSLITIRGRNSIGNSSEPLYVVDGIIIDDLNSINSYDVASIEVLKDAASAAIYGAQGSNGVILVTTKSGRSGEMRVSFDMTLGIQEAERGYDMMNKEEFYDYANMYWDRKFLLAGGDPSTPWEDRPSNQRIPEYIHTTPYEDLPNTDWQDLMFDPALKQSYQIDLSGGTDKTTYYFSARYLDQDGIFINTNLTRLSLRAKVESKLNDWLNVGINIAPTFENSNSFKSEGKNNLMQVSMFMNPLQPDDQNTYDTEFWYSGMRQPYLRQKEKIDEDRDNSVTANVFAEIEFFKGLKWRTSLGLNTGDGNSKFFESSRFNKTPNGFYNTYNRISRQIDNTLVYEKTLGRHNINVLAGQSAQYQKFWSSQQAGNGYPNDFVYTLNAASASTKNNTYESETSLLSFFGRLQYDFDKKYLLTINARYDGSSRFGPDNKWGFFPSASAGWKISEENFMSDISWISLLKLRASVGRAGNNRIGDYRWLSNLGAANYNSGGQLVNGYVPSNYSNRELGWEEIISRNIGLDLWMLEDRVQFGLDVYNNSTDGILMNVPLPAQTGFNSTTKNNGEISNKGVEVDIAGHIISTSKIKWFSSFNISHNKNEVVDISDPITLNRYGNYARLEEGYPIYNFYLYTWDGLVTQEDLDNGYDLPGSLVGGLKYKDLNGDNAITSDDISMSGSPFPDFIYGWTNNISYGNFDLSILLQGQSGGNVLWMAARQNDAGNENNSFSHWANNYKSESDPGDGRYPITGSKWLAYSDHDLYSSDYIRLKNIDLSYNVPASFAKRMKMSSAVVSLSVENAFYWIMDKNYPGVNLEAATAWTGPSNGADYITYPMARTYNLRLKLNF